MVEAPVTTWWEISLPDYAWDWLSLITEEPTAADTERVSAPEGQEEARGQMLSTAADTGLASARASGPRVHEGRFTPQDTATIPESSTHDSLGDVFDFERLVERESREFIERIEMKLIDDREEADVGDDVAPSHAAVQMCLDLARRLAPHVVLAPQVKSGAFSEDNGGISLVLQSLVTDRRLDVQITPEGTVLSAIRIDEHMQADSVTVSLNDPNAPRELAEWVTSRV